jgi:hypothetical protein
MTLGNIKRFLSSLTLKNPYIMDIKHIIKFSKNPSKPFPLEFVIMKNKAD